MSEIACALEREEGVWSCSHSRQGVVRGHTQEIQYIFYKYRVAASSAIEAHAVSPTSMSSSLTRISRSGCLEHMHHSFSFADRKAHRHASMTVGFLLSSALLKVNR
jgi:hypothetical protein